MQLVCKICGYIATSKQGFNSHLSHKHHIKSKDYYDAYLKKSNDGICCTCGKKTKFRNMWYGYNKHCCTKCIPLDPTIQTQMKVTCQEKYGVDYAWQADEVKEKSKQTTLKHFGVEYYFQTDECRKIVANNSKSEKVKNKIKQTVLAHYGVEYSWQADEVKEKSKQTMIQKYGVDNAAKSSEIRHKSIKTSTKNGKRSSLELYLEQVFIKNNISFISEYSSDLYPYHCDFYLPDKDIYVEIHGYWMHGSHWFNENNQSDINLVEIWKSKTNKPQYAQAITTWTIIDPKKRQYAKNNNINYVVLWNKQDIDNWINNNFEPRQDY